MCRAGSSCFRKARTCAECTVASFCHLPPKTELHSMHSTRSSTCPFLLLFLPLTVNIFLYQIGIYRYIPLTLNFVLEICHRPPLSFRCVSSTTKLLSPPRRFLLSTHKKETPRISDDLPSNHSLLTKAKGPAAPIRSQIDQVETAMLDQ